MNDKERLLQLKEDLIWFNDYMAQDLQIANPEFPVIADAIEKTLALVTYCLPIRFCRGKAQ